MECVGIHYFTGTQKKKVEKIIEEATFLKDYCDALKKNMGFQAQILEFGTGMAVPYFDGEDFENDLRPLEIFAEFLRTEGSRYQWVLEFGRFIVASCGYYVTEVVDQKKNHNVNYSIVDGGINHLNYYGQNMAMRIPVITHIKSDEQNGKDVTEKIEWSICGSLCTFADVLVRKTSFVNLQIGDRLVFHNAGAYSVTEAIYLLLSRAMPEVHFVENNRLKIVREGLEIWDLNSVR